MPIEEELHEHAEHARDPFDRRVAATMAIIAAALAVVSVLGHIRTTEEIVMQQRAADEWAFSQAKNIRRYESQVAADILSRLPGAAADADRYRENMARYDRETNENQHRAQELEAERDTEHHQAVRLHFGEVFLEVSIVLASLAIVTKRPVLWWASIAGSGIGLVIAASSALIR